MSNSGELATETSSRPSMLAGRSWSLVIVAGPDRGLTFPITAAAAAAGGVVVGTGDGCAVRLRDRRVSREHLRILFDDDALLLADLGSKNGSYCAGAQFSTLRVHGSVGVRLGDETEVQLVALMPPGVRPTPAVFGELIGVAPRMRQAIDLLERFARLDVAVLLTGETGCGKDLAARALHAASPRRDAPLVVVDLAGLPDTLLASELYGHRRGAFTGATTDRIGAFEQAQGGTVFLDEIGELPASAQPLLLRALESRRIKPLGDGEYRDVDTRVIAATNRNLAAEVKEGRFRADLFHRLAVACVELPPLRERAEDIPHLVARFVGRLTAPDEPPFVIPDDTMQALCAYDWPGNIRQLRNVIERAAALGHESRLIDRAVLGIVGANATAAVSDKPDTLMPFKDAKEQLVVAWERQYLRQLLSSHTSIAGAARAAGIARMHLYRLMQRHGMAPRGGDAALAGAPAASTDDAGAAADDAGAS